MNRPLYDIWMGWSMRKIDDVHYYKMGAWIEPQPHRQRIFIRISEAINKVLIVISCRLDALNKQAYAMSEKQCICAEA